LSVSEFDLIRQYFAEATAARADVLLGIGDDCALLQPPLGACLAVSIDTLVEGRHFLPGTDPESLGHKALAVNLSDLAAMGARPAWATLALTLPDADVDWLRHFMQGFAALAAEHQVQLVGGDTTRGPLSITVQVHGFVDPSKVLRRAGGRPGDLLFVSGRVGDAALALQRLEGAVTGAPCEPSLQERLDRPSPRVSLGLLLLGRANAAIDVSDGLIADLGHICAASGTGARVELGRLPVSQLVGDECATGNWRYALAGGDDYELLFSIEPARAPAMQKACAGAGQQVQEVGCLVDDSGITLVYPDGRESEEIPDGFDHFRT
jgi:thiamine-monophosphate kinase